MDLEIPVKSRRVLWAAQLKYVSDAENEHIFMYLKDSFWHVPSWIPLPHVLWHYWYSLSPPSFFFTPIILYLNICVNLSSCSCWVLGVRWQTRGGRFGERGQTQISCYSQPLPHTASVATDATQRDARFSKKSKAFLGDWRPRIWTLAISIQK